MNEKLFDNLYNASEYFKVIRVLEEAKEMYLSEERSCKEKYESLKEKNKKTPLIILFPVFGLFIIFIGLMLREFSFSFFYIVLGLVMCFIPIITKLIKPKKKRKADKFWEIEGKQACENAKKNYSRACEEQRKFMNANSEVIEFLPNCYRNYQATAWMALAVANGRADTFKEAANLYEEQLHRWELESINREVMYQQSEMQNNLAALYEQQGKANKMLQSIEALEYFNTFTRR